MNKNIEKKAEKIKKDNDAKTSIKDNRFKLDLKDRKILYELDLNSRASCSLIAKKVGLSTEVVNYRIKKLEEEKIITQYQTIINLYKLGIIQFKICLSFEHLNSEKIKEILRELEKKDSVKWVVSCSGNWDLIISLETKSIEEVNNIKNEILELFENYVREKSISILVEAITYDRAYILDKSQSEAREIMKKSEEVELEDIDLEILKKLSENARISIIDLASNLKKSIRVVEYRIKQMVKNKVILGFKIALNYEKLGIHFFKTFIYLDNKKNERTKELERYFEREKNIIHNVKVIGNWDFEPEFEVYSENEFNYLIEGMKDRFSDIIKKIDIIKITKEHKFVYF
jgi:DNA-binding Lrp family transcriptional regulator